MVHSARLAANPRDPAAARARILAAAAEEFAAAGFAGARVDAVARQAGCNKRMLYHYFGDKQGLYRAVLEQRLGSANGADLDPLTARLLLWDLLQPVDAGEASSAVAAWTARSAARLTDAQRGGRLPAVPAEQLARLLLWAQVLWQAGRDGNRPQPWDRELLPALLAPRPTDTPLKPRVRLEARVTVRD